MPRRDVKPVGMKRTQQLPSVSFSVGSGAPHPTVRGIDIDWLHESQLVQLNRWRCHESGTGITDERQQHWRVIGFVHAGAYQLHSPRGQALIDPMNVAFLNPHEPYQTSHPCGCGDRGSSMILREDMLREIVAERRPDLADSAADPFTAPSGPCPSRAFIRHRRLMRQLEGREPVEPIAVEEAALAVAAEIVGAALAPGQTAARRRSRSARRDLAEETQLLLGREFRHRVRLADLARAVDTTPYHLCRVFREVCGMPIHRYLTLLRLRGAVEALAQDVKDLSSLALDLGFSSHSHFTESFRREFGFPPSRFRRPGPG